MNMFTQEEAKRITDRVLALTKADECEVSLSGSRTGNIRYARNTVSTAGWCKTTTWWSAWLLASAKARPRSSTSSMTNLERVVRRAEDLARPAPENPEFVPTVPKQA